MVMSNYFGGLSVPTHRLRARFGTPRLLDVAVIVVVTVSLAASFIGPLIAPPSALMSNISDALMAPSSAHWFGTDDQGRDVFWRVVAGAQPSLLSSLVIVAGFSVIGAVIAALASFCGRFVDGVLMRFTDAMMAIPTIIFALGFAAALGPGLQSAIVALIITAWPVTARLLRGQMQQALAMPYVAGARVLGVGPIRLLYRHVLPNSLDALIVKWGADIGSTVLVISSLSFIGVGPQPPSPEWGAMVSAGANYISSAWWMAVFPGLAIAIVAVAFALLADILQERFAAGGKR